MAYRKTPAILAEIESRRAAIVAATEQIVAVYGVPELTIELVAQTAKISVGLIYKHFPDKAELIPTMVGNALARDMAALNGFNGPLPSELMHATAVIYSSMRSVNLNATLFASAIYRDGLRGALARILLPLGPMTPARAKIASGAILGATRGIWEAMDGDRRGLPHVFRFALMLAGYTEHAASNMMERYSLA